MSASTRARFGRAERPLLVEQLRVQGGGNGDLPPGPCSRPRPLVPGEVGYLIAGIKTVADTRVGDTVTDNDTPCAAPLAGFREVKPVVFSSIYPVDANDYEELVESMAKLKLNDASLIYEKDSSVALGYGFRCGFLGLLHLEIVQERLEREFEMSIVFTAPSVQYRITLQGGKEILVDNPANFPDPSQITQAEEPFISASMITPSPVPRQHHHAVPGEARDAEEHDLPRREARGAGLRDAPGGGGVRLLRQVEIHEPRLRLLRLPDPGVSRHAAGRSSTS